MSVERWFGPPRGRRLRIARVVVVLAILAGVLAYALLPGHKRPPPPPSLIAPGVALGITANALEGNDANVEDVVRKLGVGWIREEFRWPVIQPTKDEWSFARYDALMESAARRDLRVLPVLIQSPRWLTAQPFELPPDTKAWGRFVSHVVSRYGTDGSFWQAHPGLDARLAPTTFELWNEPYYPQFSSGGPNPGRYAALVRTGVTAGRQANPDARFLVAAEASYTTASNTVGNWLDDVLKANPKLGRFIDGLAVHPYSTGGPLNTSLPRVQQVMRVVDFNATLARYGISQRPIWITEMGWSTCTARPACVTEAQQATYLRQLLLEAELRWPDLVKGIFIYRLTDIPAAGAADPQSSYGLETIDGRHKPAYGVVAEAAAQTID
jgi:hypothetical protein